MTATVNSDTIIYPALMQTGYLERKQDNLNVFNAASASAILLTNELVMGDYSASAFYKIGGSIAHRDVNSVAAVTNEKIAMDEMVGIKTPWKYGPYATTEEAFKRRGKSPAEFSMLIGQDMADATAEGFIEFALGSLEAAIRANATMVTSGDLAVEGKKVLTKGLRTMGDKFGTVALWVMDSMAYLDIVDESIDNKLFEEAGVVVYGGVPGTMGKPVLVTDQCPADTIFGLNQGAVTVKESQAPATRAYPIENQENLAIGYRGEGTCNIEVLGYKWKDKAVTNPNPTALKNSSNWEKYATDNKATAGFIIDLIDTVAP